MNYSWTKKIVQYIFRHFKSIPYPTANTVTDLVYCVGLQIRDGSMVFTSLFHKGLSARALGRIIKAVNGAIHDLIPRYDPDPIRTVQPPSDHHGGLLHHVHGHGLELAHHLVVQDGAGGPDHAGAVLLGVGGHGELVDVVGG